MVLFIVIFLLVLTLIDFYSYQAIRAVTRKLKDWPRRILRWGWWLWSLGLAVTLILTSVFYEEYSVKSIQAGFQAMGLVIMSLIPKLIISVFLLLEDVFRSVAGIVRKIRTSKVKEEESTPFFESRRRFISTTGLALAAIPFSSVIYGMVRGQYKFTVHEVDIAFPDLPEAFDGFTITQISDIHSGGFDDYDAVRKGVELAMEQQSDLMVFTGDLVNSFAEEMDDWVELFSELDAPLGKFAVLGNHDYGVHGGDFKSDEEQAANLVRVKQQYANIGFRLLNNENHRITRDGQSLVLAGVENWGSPPFPQHGDLDKSLIGTNPDDFTVLLSHDPSHYESVVLDHKKHVHLTLSGHTHGMQFGIEVPGIKWSPVKYRYPRWAGLYNEGQQYLYVNRGFGCIGFPGRVGIWPEVTKITLRREA